MGNMNSFAMKLHLILTINFNLIIGNSQGHVFIIY